MFRPHHIFPSCFIYHALWCALILGAPGATAMDPDPDSPAHLLPRVIHKSRLICQAQQAAQWAYEATDAHLTLVTKDPVVWEKRQEDFDLYWATMWHQKSYDDLIAICHHQNPFSAVDREALVTTLGFCLSFSNKYEFEASESLRVALLDRAMAASHWALTLLKDSLIRINSDDRALRETFATLARYWYRYLWADKTNDELQAIEDGASPWSDIKELMGIVDLSAFFPHIENLKELLDTQKRVSPEAREKEAQWQSAKTDAQKKSLKNFGYFQAHLALKLQEYTRKHQDVVAQKIKEYWEDPCFWDKKTPQDLEALSQEQEHVFLGQAEEIFQVIESGHLMLSEGDFIRFFPDLLAFGPPHYKLRMQEAMPFPDLAFNFTLGGVLDSPLAQRRRDPKRRRLDFGDDTPLKEEAAEGGSADKGNMSMSID